MKFLRRREVEERVRKSTSTLYNDVKHGRFPGPVKIGVAAVAWPEHEIEAWENERIAERDRGVKRT